MLPPCAITTISTYHWTIRSSYQSAMQAGILSFTSAFADTVHPVIPLVLQWRTHHTLFVNKNISISIHLRMREAVRAAVGSAYNFIGHPIPTRCESCEKLPLSCIWAILLTHRPSRSCDPQQTNHSPQHALPPPESCEHTPVL
jgi:hypothetical protein